MPSDATDAQNSPDWSYQSNAGATSLWFRSGEPRMLFESDNTRLVAAVDAASHWLDELFEQWAALASDAPSNALRSPLHAAVSAWLAARTDAGVDPFTSLGQLSANQQLCAMNTIPESVELDARQGVALRWRLSTDGESPQWALEWLPPSSASPNSRVVRSHGAPGWLATNDPGDVPLGFARPEAVTSWDQAQQLGVAPVPEALATRDAETTDRAPASPQNDSGAQTLPAQPAARRAFEGNRFETIGPGSARDTVSNPKLADGPTTNSTDADASATRAAIPTATEADSAVKADLSEQTGSATNTPTERPAPSATRSGTSMDVDVSGEFGPVGSRFETIGPGAPRTVLTPDSTAAQVTRPELRPTSDAQISADARETDRQAATLAALRTKLDAATKPMFELPDANDAGLFDLELDHAGFDPGRAAQLLSISLGIDRNDADALCGRAPVIIAKGLSARDVRRVDSVVRPASGARFLAHVHAGDDDDPSTERETK